MTRRIRLAPLCLVAVLPAMALAQTTPAAAPAAPAAAAPVAAPAPVPAAPAMREIVVSPNTEVVVTPNDTLTTKSMKVGDKFRLAVVLDVMQDGVIVIPKGTPGEGTVSYQTGTGAFGKSGKLEVSFNWLDLGGQHVPLSGKFRQEGEGNTGAAVAAVVAVGVFGAFVTGHSAVIVNGQELRAHTVEPLHLAVAADTPVTRTATIVAAAPAAAVAAAAPVAAAAAAVPAAIIAK